MASKDEPAMPARVPAPQTDGHVRHTLEWHGGTTLVVFEEIGPQFAISVCGSSIVERGPRDRATHRETLHSMCLTYADVPVLEKALAEWRAKYPLAAEEKVVIWNGWRMKEGRCPAGDTCLACDRLGKHLEPV